MAQRNASSHVQYNNTREKCNLNRRRLFGERMAGALAEVCAGPVSLVNAGNRLKAALKSSIKAFTCEFGGILPFQPLT